MFCKYLNQKTKKQKKEKNDFRLGVNRECVYNIP